MTRYHDSGAASAIRRGHGGASRPVCVFSPGAASRFPMCFLYAASMSSRKCNGAGAGWRPEIQ